MASSNGRGLQRGVPRYAPWRNLFDIEHPGMSRFIALDWYWARPAYVSEIPWTWLSGPLRFRPDPPLNAAAVSTSGGATSYATDQDSIDKRGQRSFTHTTYSDNEKDAANLAAFIVAYYRNPRVRLAQSVLILNKRTPGEIRLILDLEVGDRIRITDTPVGWPEGGVELVIEGITHRAAVDMRTVSWSLAPVIGASPDVSGPWFRLGDSMLGGDDALPW